MKTKIFEQICIKRVQLLKNKQIDFASSWQFIECDVGLLLKERQELRRLLICCRNDLLAVDSDFTEYVLYNQIQECLDEKE